MIERGGALTPTVRAVLMQFLGAAISTAIALGAMAYYQAQRIATLEQQAVENLRRDDAQDQDIVSMEERLQDVSSLRLQVQNNRAVIEVYGKRVERQEDRRDAARGDNQRSPP